MKEIKYFYILFVGGGGVLGVTESKPSALSLSILLVEDIFLNNFPGDFVSTGDRASKHNSYK